jgi:hypothetical protein
MNSTPPPAKPSAAEPIKQISDPTLPNNTVTGCGMGMPEGSGSHLSTKRRGTGHSLDGSGPKPRRALSMSEAAGIVICPENSRC